MLYPLSYEGGGVFLQVRRYFPAEALPVPFDSVPVACPSIGEQRFLEPLLIITSVRGVALRDSWSRRRVL